MAAIAPMLKPDDADDPRRRLPAALLAVWSSILLLATCAGSVEPLVRYLHPFSFTALAALAFLLETVLRRRT